MSEPGEPVRVRLTFRALPDEVPVGVRVRRLLKHALRSCRLRCELVEDYTEGGPQQQEGMDRDERGD